MEPGKLEIHVSIPQKRHTKTKKQNENIHNLKEKTRLSNTNESKISR